jgi:hypothetical protein
MDRKKKGTGLQEGGEVLAKKNRVESVKDSDSRPDSTETKKSVALRGRPKSRPESKATIFHLPLSLIKQINEESDKNMAGNKSAFAVKIFSEYFAAKLG